jgi:hypothetical protein
LSQFKAYYNDWLDVSGLKSGNGKNHKVNLDPEFFNNLAPFSDAKKKRWRIEAAKRCAETLGQFPALCFSGGIDSQAMLHCWAEADLEAHVIIFTFKDGLNKQDCEHAKSYCHTHDIPYREIEFDIVQFLTRDNVTVTESYGGVSPQFNTHYRFVEILTHMGYTGVCFGGLAPDRNTGVYGMNQRRVPLHWSIVDNFPIPVQGSFLSFSPELSWAITLQMKDIEEPKYEFDTHTKQLEAEARRYEQKVLAYKKCGFEIIQQPRKYTGFELVKEYFEELTGDGWSFEKRFRTPLMQVNGGIYNKDRGVYQIDLTDEQYKAIDSIYLKHFPPSD